MGWIKMEVLINKVEFDPVILSLLLCFLSISTSAALFVDIFLQFLEVQSILNKVLIIFLIM